MAASRPHGAARPARLALRAAALVLVALTAANCAGPQVAGRKGGGNKYGVKPSPKVIPDGQPIPKGGGREMIGQPYTIGGRTYVPHHGKGYNREGWASWYGTAFHGRLTANNEIFDRHSIAAAHPTLPLPSYVRVTNLVNKRSMVVRVNDRGPYERDRILDVSERVADALEFRRKGVTRVRVEYLGKASVRGSDDEKLLATLRIDGSPAPFGRPGGATMYADLRHDPPPRPRFAPAETGEESSQPVLRVAAAAAEPEEGSDAPAEPVRTSGPTSLPQSRPVRTAAAPSRDGEVPLPPVRPLAARRLAEAAPAVPGGASAPLAAAQPVPPQRPIYAGIY
ncbi:septal ring lytic transglycosylase RlpA family protein [Enterovirga aerilata]|uniref:Endolytic peptidoglycan transglycosylase RlpA n=1 Tax=Enterovirga aerilata TaxID=2730920 RepID=A0A849I6Y2_9HYPH|nr:septal ring lytic transglycosylase RlpA family protein [Enterovirga sp. DB1703]